MVGIKQKIIFQTLEDRDNPNYVERNGPFPCNRTNAWLGDGYYFWDTFVENAHWWGEYCNNSNGRYIICKAVCDYDPNLCFDLTGGNMQHLEYFNEVILMMKKQGLFTEKTTVARIIKYLKDDLKIFKYEASRVYGVLSKSVQSKYSSTVLFSIGKPQYLDTKPAIQICFYTNKSLNLKTFI